MKVLIADDEPLARERLAALLADARAGSYARRRPMARRPGRCASSTSPTC